MKKNNKLFALWLMGPTASGKTTLAEALHKKLISIHIPTLHFDGDEIRDLFGVGLDFKKENRLKVVKNLVHFANKAIKSNINVIISALTANEESRGYVYKNVLNLKIGYVECNIAACIERDPKGLYGKAIKGEINTLIGYNSPYLCPEKYHFKINTDINNINKSVEIIMQHLRINGET